MILKDKRVVVTGGSRGIGRAIVKCLAEEGARVLFTYHSSPDKAEELLSELALKGLKAFGFQADVASSSDASLVVSEALEKLGGLDCLVNNAGITKDGLMLRMSDQDFSRVLDTNLKGAFYYTKASLKPMISQRYGRIVNISSVVGITGNPGQANYVASKAGIIGLTKSNAKELASRNITVNSVAPGFVDTDMSAALNDKQKEAILSGVPLKRMATPEDIANAVLFFLSPMADYVTGQVLAVDGGMTM